MKRVFVKDVEIANLLLAKYDEKLDIEIAKNKKLKEFNDFLVCKILELEENQQELQNLLDDYD